MSLRPFALERYFAGREFSTRRLLGSSDPETWKPLGDRIRYRFARRLV
jgi:hypothetical protein